jgi:hypothetical protein
MSFLLVASVFVILSQGCQKGSDGAVGATGATGATGAQGATGPQGPAGDTGTANVIYSNWTTVTFTGSGTAWYATINAPEITQGILDSGEVKTYFEFGSEVFDGDYSNLTTGHSIYQYLTVGSINLTATFDATYPWRYIIVPGGVEASMAGRGVRNGQGNRPNVAATDSLNVKTMNYSQICHLFNIPE